MAMRQRREGGETVIETCFKIVRKRKALEEDYGKQRPSCRKPDVGEKEEAPYPKHT